MPAGEIEVETADGNVHRAGHVVLAADAWTNELLRHFDRRLPLTITKEQVTYFACPDPVSLRAGPLPDLDLDGRAVLLRLPDLWRARPEGRPGRRRRRDNTRRPGRSTATRPLSGASRSFLARHLPGHLGPPIYTKTCLYTLTPDRDFVLDRLPDHPNVLVALGAAHGFKFASLFGRIAAELVADGEDTIASGDRALPNRPADPARSEPGDELHGMSPQMADLPTPRASHRAFGPATPSASLRPRIPWEKRSELQRAVAGLEAWGLNVRLGDHVNDRHGYMAGRDEDRAADLNAMWRDPEIRAIVCLQGGYGSPRLIPLLDREAIAANPKAICGYSDITALHLAVAAWGNVISFYSNGAMGVGATDVTDFSKETFRRALFSDEPYGPDRPESGRPVGDDDPRRQGNGPADRRLLRARRGNDRDADRDRDPGQDPVPRDDRRSRDLSR